MIVWYVEQSNLETNLPITEAKVCVFEVKVVESRREQTETASESGPNGHNRTIYKIELVIGVVYWDATAIFAQTRGCLGQAYNGVVRRPETIDQGHKPVVSCKEDIAIEH